VPDAFGLGLCLSLFSSAAFYFPLRAGARVARDQPKGAQLVEDLAPLATAPAFDKQLAA
jgi:hypothetical protein